MNQPVRQYKFNIPTEIKRWLAIEAAKNMRSQSAEIILALKEKMERQAAQTATNEKTGQ